MCKSFTAGVAAGMIAGAAVALMCMPKKRRCPAQVRAARVLKTMSDVVDNVGDLFR